MGIVVLLFVAYNLFRFPARFKSLSNESLSVEQVNELKDEMKTKDDKKVLVAYFSYSGTTKGVADTCKGTKRLKYAVSSIIAGHPAA